MFGRLRARRTDNEGVRDVMAEIGIDLFEEFPKMLTEYSVLAAEVVITMGCGDACPVQPGKRYLDSEVEEPVNKPIDRLRAIRNEIERRVQALVEESARLSRAETVIS